MVFTKDDIELLMQKKVIVKGYEGVEARIISISENNGLKATVKVFEGSDSNPMTKSDSQTFVIPFNEIIFDEE